MALNTPPAEPWPNLCLINDIEYRWGCVVGSEASFTGFSNHLSDGASCRWPLFCVCYTVAKYFIVDNP